MLEEYNKKIESIREALDTLPKNNKKNISKYINELNKYLEEFNNYKNIIENEIRIRRDNLINNKDIIDVTNINDSLNIYTNNMYLLTNYSTSYEKSGLDKIIYNIAKYYKTNLEEVNKNIINGINLFNNIGIKLTINDFTYSIYSNKYMEVVFNNINNIDTELVRNSFQEIYWKCSDILDHISLNFRYLYYKYKKYFDTYCDNQINKFLQNKKKEEVINNYKNLKIKYDTTIDSDIIRILNKFKNKELIINDYEEEKINNTYNELINNVPYDEDIINDLISYKSSILEYNSYLSIKYIIDNLIDLYNKEHTNYKSNISKNIKEINKLENKLFTNNKKINKIINGKKSIFNKKDNSSKLLIDSDNIIKDIKDKYNQLDIDLFKDKFFTLFNDNNTYYDLLELIYNNYIYLIKIIKLNNKDISDNDIEVEINKIKDILYNSYNTFINNINIINNKDIKIILYDKYKLSNFNINENTFDNESDLTHALELIEKILTNYYISKSYMNTLDIKFLCNIEEYKL